MQKLILSMSAVLLTSLAVALPAAAAFHQRSYGHITAAERAAIARSQHQLDLIKARAWADGHITAWERAKIDVAQARHRALVYRLRHN